jgi:cytochrome c biogenesis factor
VTTVITPTVTADAQKGLVATPITLTGTMIEVALDTPQVGQVVISVLDVAKSTGATPPFITLEVSREPGINLLWAGLIIVAIGTAIAAVRRRLEGRWVLDDAEPVVVSAAAATEKKKAAAQPARARR